ncbi:MAG: hypothetical protein K5799_15225, partial [Erythrobacter sp.]|nr:hypothetical protein [Erythrobacter sp.]
IVTQLPFGDGWIGVGVGLALVSLALLEITGVLGQLGGLRRWVETSSHKRLREIFGGRPEPWKVPPHPQAGEAATPESESRQG